jgi:hypothetical protein
VKKTAVGPAYFGCEVFNRVNFSGRMNTHTEDGYSVTLIRWIWCNWCGCNRALVKQHVHEFELDGFKFSHSCHVCQDSGAVARAMRIA